MRNTFYDELENVKRHISNRDFMIIAGDFNAKTGREWRKYPNNIGKYGKGDINSNGKELLERSEEHTSELQSRETISYAVFCLKKKIPLNIIT